MTAEGRESAHVVIRFEWNENFFVNNKQKKFFYTSRAMDASLRQLQISIAPSFYEARCGEKLGERAIESMRPSARIISAELASHEVRET
jgi:predicted nuclease of restriction endonuclease-like (RecB) superfamily